MTFRQESNSASTLRLPLLAVGTFVLGIDGFIFAGLLPSVAHDLGVSLATAGQLTTVFAITYAVGSPVIAAATGRLDRRTVLFGGLILFMIGMVAQAAGPVYWVVLLGRVLAGLGAAAFQATAYAVAGYLSTPERRGRALAVVAAGYTLATVAGVPLGILLAQAVGWRGVMWIIAAATVLASVTPWAIPAVKLPPTSLGERLRVLTRPRLLGLLLLTALVVLPSFAVISYIAPLLGQTTASEAGPVTIALVIYGIAAFASTRIVGPVNDRIGPVRTLVIGIGGAVVALVALGLLHRWLVPAAAALALLGVVNSFLVVPQQSRVFEAGGAAATVALGLNGSMIYVGSGAGAAIGGAVLGSGGSEWIAPAAAGIALLGLAAALASARALAPRPELAIRTSSQGA